MRCAPSGPRSRKKTLFQAPDSDTAGDRLLVGASPVDLTRLRRAVLVAPAATAAPALIPAAVLFPVVLHAAGPTVLLTRRTEQLRDHAGQISFPGGRVESDDASPADTALREAWEEVGLSRAQTEVIGYLPEYCTVTGFRITPVLAFLTPPIVLKPDAMEVAEVFEVPLGFLLDPANQEQREHVRDGRLRHYFAMTFEQRTIWGATAGIIVSLARALAALP